MTTEQKPLQAARFILFAVIIVITLSGHILPVFLEYLPLSSLMDAALITLGFFFAFILFIVLVLCIRQVNQFERGILLTMGKYSKMWQPGWHIIIPVFQRLIKVDVRVKAVDVPDQEAITKDNIPIRINAVIYYKIGDASKAVLEVENFFNAVSQLAQTTMRNAVGEVKLDELLSNKKQVSENIKTVVDKVSDTWGVDVQSVELKDIVLPETLKRTIAKVAEADRERQAVIIASQGEVEASTNVAKAAELLAKTPGALHLRTLQSINDISSDQSNTTVWMVPVEVLRALEGLGKK